MRHSASMSYLCGKSCGIYATLIIVAFYMPYNEVRLDILYC